VKSDPSRPFARKNIRLRPPRYLGRQIYFFTLCFDNRRRFGGNARIAQWIISLLRQHANEWNFFVHAYCVMPDHVHILAVGAKDGSNAVAFIESFKQDTAHEFTQRTHRRLWQFKYYDRILRRRDSVDRVSWYIWLNPVRKGVCADPRDYAFAGSFTEIGMKLLRSFTPLEWRPPWKKEEVNVAPVLSRRLRPGSVCREARHFGAQR
jgi:REP element-mobilizing transposase RayT